MTKCLFDPCGNAVYCKGLCSGHYTQKRRGGELKPIVIKTDSTKLPCSFDGCTNKQRAKGLCSAHWYQQQYMGKLTVTRNQIEIIDRIMNQVNKTNYCWEWTGRKAGKKQNSYGQIYYNGRQQMVHRIVYEELVRPLEISDTVDHLCRNKFCVNPDHLEAVPLRENVKRMHAYRSLEREISRLIDFIEAMGYDSKTLLPKE